MDEDTKSLLTRIGQPDFAYRDFGGGDEDAELARWPLLRVIAALPQLAAGPFRPQRREDAVAPHPGGGFLSAYDATRPASAKAPSGDVRALLNRLSEGRS